MNLKFHSAVIFCNDIVEMTKFYEQLLGQKIVRNKGQCVVFENGFSLWKPESDFPISRELGYSYEPLGNRNLEICFETENIGDAVEMVLTSELRILHNVTEEAWGQYTIRFYDPEGNLVEIGESMRSMITRMLNSGMSEDEISTRSGLTATYIGELLAN